MEKDLNFLFIGFLNPWRFDLDSVYDSNQSQIRDCI